MEVEADTAVNFVVAVDKCWRYMPNEIISAHKASQEVEELPFIVAAAVMKGLHRNISGAESRQIAPGGTSPA